MEIQLEDDTKKDEKQDIPIYVTAIFIAISGVGFLLFTVYYIAFLPVPTPMQPLKVRILTTLQLEEAQNNNLDVVEVVELSDTGKTGIRVKPAKNSVIIVEVAKGGYYEKIEEKENWVKIRNDEYGTEGWIEKEYVQDVENE